MTSLPKSSVSLVAQWVLVPEDSSSSPGGGEKFSYLVFESRSGDCQLNYKLINLPPKLYLYLVDEIINLFNINLIGLQSTQISFNRKDQHNLLERAWFSLYSN